MSYLVASQLFESYCDFGVQLYRCLAVFVCCKQRSRYSVAGRLLRVDREQANSLLTEYRGLLELVVEDIRSIRDIDEDFGGQTPWQLVFASQALKLERVSPICWESSPSSVAVKKCRSTTGSSSITMCRKFLQSRRAFCVSMIPKTCSR